jgi:hypothetical protein
MGNLEIEANSSEVRDQKLPMAFRTRFSFSGKNLYFIEGKEGKLFTLHATGEVCAYLTTRIGKTIYRFVRCLKAEEEIENLGWIPINDF